LINGNCYDDGEVNPENQLQSCNATNSATEWTEEVTPPTTTAAPSTEATSTSAGSTSIDTMSTGTVTTGIMTTLAPGSFSVLYHVMIYKLKL